MGNRNRCKLLSAALAAALTLSLSSAALAAEPAEKHVSILATSDLHSNIWGYSYEDNAETTNNGMARIYTYVQQVRAEEGVTSFLVDGGDTIQGTILSDDLYNKEEGEHPVITAMNFMGYDAMTLGNHEFNFGLELVDRIQSQADFPLLAANVTVKDTGEQFVGDYTIVERDGIKLAIIGVTNPNIPIWDDEKVASLDFEALSDAVGRCIDQIGDQADIIMVSCHTGLVAEFDEENDTDAAQTILDDHPEVDVLQVGHFHTVVNQKQGDAVVGGVRNGGRDVARFDVTLDGDNNVVDTAVTIVDMADYQPSAQLRELPIVAQAHQRTIDFINGGGSGDENQGGGVLGSTTAKFQPEDEISGLPAGRLMDTAVMDLINKVQLENSGADVSAAALFKNTSDLPQGEINYGNIFNIYKFDNTLYRVTVTGAELKAYMEWSAACYNQWQPGDINISFDPEYPDYLYDMFAGVDYEIDLSQPKGQRIRNVMFHGQPLQDDQELTLAVNNYRYSSALKSENIISGTRDWESPNSIRDMLVAYFAEHSPVAPEVDNNWKIVGVDLSESDPRRQEIIDLVNAGRLDTPYDKSYNLNDYEAILASARPAGNVSVNGTLSQADSAVSGGTTFYRLRDLAVAFKGSAAAFNAEWKDGVVLTKGGTYTAEPLAPRADGTTVTTASLTVTVDGAPVEVSGLLIGGNYYVSAQTINALLGISAVETDGVLTFSDK